MAVFPHSTLVDANERRTWRIFEDISHVLIRMAQDLCCNEPFALELDQPLFAFDSASIDLCLSLFPWAQFRSTKAEVKMHTHTLFDLRGAIPTYPAITPAKVHDVCMLDSMPVAEDVIYIMDKGYVLCRFFRLFILRQQ